MFEMHTEHAWLNADPAVRRLLLPLCGPPRAQHYGAPAVAAGGSLCGRRVCRSTGHGARPNSSPTSPAVPIGMLLFVIVGRRTASSATASPGTNSRSASPDVRSGDLGVGAVGLASACGAVGHALVLVCGAKCARTKAGPRSFRVSHHALSVPARPVWWPSGLTLRAARAPWLTAPPASRRSWPDSPSRSPSRPSAPSPLRHDPGSDPAQSHV